MLCRCSCEIIGGSRVRRAFGKNRQFATSRPALSLTAEQISTHLPRQRRNSSLCTPPTAPEVY